MWKSPPKKGVLNKFHRPPAEKGGVKYLGTPQNCWQKIFPKGFRFQENCSKYFHDDNYISCIKSIYENQEIKDHSKLVFSSNTQTSNADFYFEINDNYIKINYSKKYLRFIVIIILLERGVLVRVPWKEGDSTGGVFRGGTRGGSCVTPGMKKSGALRAPAQG